MSEELGNILGFFTVCIIAAFMIHVGYFDKKVAGATRLGARISGPMLILIMIIYGIKSLLDWITR